MALWRRGKQAGIIVHSDQASTYASNGYQQLLNKYGLICSMGHKGECLDNAVAASFFGTLKTECIDHQDYHTHAQAKQDLFEYIGCSKTNNDDIRIWTTSVRQNMRG
jgi:putative transposase